MSTRYPRTNDNYSLSFIAHYSPNFYRGGGGQKSEIWPRLSTHSSHFGVVSVSEYPKPKKVRYTKTIIDLRHPPEIRQTFFELRKLMCTSQSSHMQQQDIDHGTYFMLPSLPFPPKSKSGEAPIYSYDRKRFLPRCMECNAVLTMRFLSVRLSVCPSVCQTRAL